MAVSSIHIEAGKLGYCYHNTRQRATKNSIFPENKVEYDNSAEDAIKIFRDELKKREILYTKRTGKKLHSKTIKHLSAIINLEKHHTIEDVKKIAEFLEKELGTKVFQVAVHRDEGWIDENNIKHVNYHGHIEFLGLDEEGRSVRKKLDRKFLIQLQSKVAEILKMKRGINYSKTKKPRPKRLDTYEYKKYAKDLYTEKISVKKLKSEISELRKMMIEVNKDLVDKLFTKEDYNRLSKIKQKIKKTVDLDEVYADFYIFKTEIKKRIEDLKNENESLKKKEDNDEMLYNLLIENKKLKKEIKKLKEENKNPKPVPEPEPKREEIKQEEKAVKLECVFEPFRLKLLNLQTEYNNLQTKYNDLEDKYNDLKDENNNLKEEKSDLESKISDLESEKQNLNSKIAELQKNRSKDVFEPYKLKVKKLEKEVEDLKDKNNDLKKENEALKKENNDLKSYFEKQKDWIKEMFGVTISATDTVYQTIVKIVDSVRNSIQDNIKKIEELQNKIRTKDNRISELEKEVEELNYQNNITYGGGFKFVRSLIEMN